MAVAAARWLTKEETAAVEAVAGDEGEGGAASVGKIWLGLR